MNRFVLALYFIALAPYMGSGIAVGYGIGAVDLGAFLIGTVIAVVLLVPWWLLFARQTRQSKEEPLRVYLSPHRVFRIRSDGPASGSFRVGYGPPVAVGLGATLMLAHFWFGWPPV